MRRLTCTALITRDRLPIKGSSVVGVPLEETVYSGEVPDEGLPAQQLREVLHTPFVTEVVNQIVFVPEDFFKREREAIERGEKLWHEFVTKYAKSAPIGPSDPVVSLLDRIRERVQAAPTTETLVAALHDRIAFATREHPQLWAEVVRGEGVF